jgi:diguanylate cyclase (GGDEF)-like protein/PAS domain S-box-containing protein
MLLVLFALLSFIAFFVYMKRTLRHLDPTTVMPKRVKYAFDTLTEGVIIMDAKGRIILANRAFADKLGCTVEALMGLKASQLDWINPETNSPLERAPWLEVMANGRNRSGIMANISPILDDAGRSRGALATFDDVTELERKNNQLSEMLEMLQRSNDRIELQNQELEVLATHDSLTGCLNRRAFFELAEDYMAKVAAEGSDLACIMLDIDLFKSINDNYGHGVGDQTLQYFSRNLQSEVHSVGAVCRYGGEEFCILLPDSDIERAAEIAERVRTKIVAQTLQIAPQGIEIHLSASFGVSDTNCGADGIEELLGRTRVVAWDRARETEFVQQTEDRRAHPSSVNV